ncbi:hypothetical protein [Pseudogemmobacter bohemicus]|uniref:hypothetical protein n=1 Tax=Pseudogemmobacter bohemicus TaxID=2250708 RepID=UPI0018E4DFFE|nr:hypothetical protein [Pseudogemmobacter bohemicus]
MNFLFELLLKVLLSLDLQKSPQRKSAVKLDSQKTLIQVALERAASLGCFDKRDFLELRPVIQARFHMGDDHGAQADIRR